MGTEALILATGARTPIGCSAPATAAAVRAGIACFERHPFMIDRYGQPMIVAADPLLSPDTPVLDRLVYMAHAACAEVLAAIDPTLASLSAISIAVGLPEPRPGLPDDLAPRFVASLRSMLSPVWPSLRIVAAPRGHCAGLLALATAAASAMTGAREGNCAAGVDSYLDPSTLEWLDANDQLHSENNAWGFVPGEAAGCCLLGNRSAALAAGIAHASILRASASAMESNLIKTDTVCLGEGLSQAVANSIGDLDARNRVDQLVSDVNGEPYRAEELGYAIVRQASRFNDASGFLAPADCWGDVGAASGPLFAVLADAAARRGYARGSRTVCCTSSEAGDRAALLVEFAELARA
jgi:3-oxoacyl-[acyl-carrier-protein] synthase-1